MATQQQPRATLVAVGVLSGATALSLARVFLGWGWIVPCVVAAVGSVALGVLCDRLVRSTAFTAVALVLGGALIGLEVTQAHSTFGGVPTPTALSRFGHELSQMAHILHSAAVPVPPRGTPLLLAVVALWTMGAATYLCATRLPGTLTPLVPPLTLFVTVAALGRGSQAATTAAFGGGIALFLLAQQRAAMTDRRARFHTGRSRAAVPVAGAVAAAVVAISAALIAGPTLPGAGSSPLINYRRLGGAGDGTNNLVVVTPLVDIRDRLAESPPKELFTVDSNHPTYWRIAGLDRFNGNVWNIGTRDTTTLDVLDNAPPSTGAVESIRARFNTTNLAGPWVPVPYRPRVVDLDGALVLPASDSVIVTRTSAIDARYTVFADDPAPTPDQIGRAAVATDAAAHADLALPNSFPGEVRALARQITAKAQTPYAEALALQDYLRSSRFTYSLSVPRGHSGSALVDFLFETRAGFCEQFSTAFAAMARAIGLPTRVAVGFTPGAVDPSGVYHVTTQNAHAWPEVDFAGLGWIRFEPTPGRFDPTPGDYTRTGGGATVSTTPATPTTAAPPVTTGTGATPSSAPKPRNLDIDGGADTGIATGHSRTYTAMRFVLVVLALMIGLALIAALAILALKAVRRYRRRHASSPRAQVTGAWEEALERLAEARIHRRPSSTPVEFAIREAPATGAGAAGPPLLALAHLTTSAIYAPDDPPVEAADDAWVRVHDVEVALRRNSAWRARIRRRLDPRVLRASLPGETDVADDGSPDDALVIVNV